jgi:hypothetical protein
MPLMKKSFCLTVALIFLSSTAIFAQKLQLPRDPEKLLRRAESFWTAMISGRRLQASEFVLPEKKDLFVSGSSSPVTKATIVGLDLAADPGRAAVRVTLEVLPRDLVTGRLTTTITDNWIWRKDNWFLDLESPEVLFGKGRLSRSVDPNVKEIQARIDKNFEILRNPVDLGTLVEGQFLRIDVPIKYTGDVPVSVESTLPNPLVDFEYSSTVGINPRSKQLVLLVNTANWNGPFNLPLPLKIKYQTAEVDRTLLVKGSVFVPLSFRQEPANAPIEEGREFSLFVRNNTAEDARVHTFSVDARFDVLKQPGMLPANSEAEIVLRLRPGHVPGPLELELDAPLHERKVFTYQFPNARR